MQNLEKAVNSGVDHISAYALTVEPRTALAHLIKMGKAEPVDEALAATHFDSMVDYLARHGFEQYEISNFAKNGSYAKHNTSYWKGEPYLGVGPSAHSYDHRTRSWNVANNATYLRSIAAGMLPLGTEVLTIENKFNEYIMTGLRTIWGCDLRKIEAEFGKGRMQELMQKAKLKIVQGLMKEENRKLLLTPKGRFLADGIAADLFV
jgi:oxygen-independent coproporphyrinogen-3 oxidase